MSFNGSGGTYHYTVTIPNFSILHTYTGHSDLTEKHIYFQGLGGLVDTHDKTLLLSVSQYIYYVFLPSSAKISFSAGEMITGRGW